MRSALAKLLYPFRRHLKIGPEHIFLRRLNPHRRWYIIPELSTGEFVRKLNERGVNYVAIVSAFDWNNELELLVADDDLRSLSDVLTKWPVGAPAGVYSMSGSGGYSFHPPDCTRHRMALFPPNIAKQLVEHATLDAHGTKVLGSRASFFSLAFRAAYLEASCWERQSPASEWQATRECAAKFRNLAAEAELSLPDRITPVVLDQLLRVEGWRPPADFLERSWVWAPSIRSPLLDPEEAQPPGLAVFFMRERALQDGFKDLIARVLEEEGFEPLLVLHLDSKQREIATNYFRGGNWGQNASVTGGLPGAIFVGLDVLPAAPNAQQRREQPLCDNMRIFTAKSAVRRSIRAHFGRRQRYTAIHSTDNSAQAWRAVRLLVPEREEDLRQKVEQSRSHIRSNAAMSDTQDVAAAAELRTSVSGPLSALR